MQLRPYQQAAVDAVYDYLRGHDDNPCVVIPTAGGKTPVLATICRDAVGRWGGRVLVLAHVKELLEQAVDKLRVVCPDVRFGVYSAGLRRRDTDEPVIVAGIQSVYKRACDLDAFDLVIVDECFIPGTPIATPAGEVPIEQIQPGMFVRNATGIGTVEAVAARRATNLVTLEYDDGTTLTCTPNHPIFTESGWRAAGSLAVGSLAFSIEGVRMLRQDISSVEQAASRRQPAGPAGSVVDEAAILLDLLREDSQQLHDLAGSPRKGEQVHEGQRALTSHPRRKRTAHKTTAGDARHPGPGLGPRAQRAGAQPPVSTLAEELEDRHCQSGASDRAGIGRPQPPVATAQASGLAQGALSGAKRLVRLTHYEPAGGSVVFNLQVSGHPSYFARGILVHNCHLIPEDGEGMYRQFLADAKVINPHLRVIGLTATPFRLKSGMICGPENILNRVCFEVGVRELIRDGYLCPLVTKAGINKADFDRLHVRAGEFVADEVEDLMDQDSLVEAACGETVVYSKDRSAVLIFASGIKHARHIQRVLQDKHGVECGLVCGETPADERRRLLARFRGEPVDADLFGQTQARLKYLVNVNVLTTGFDAPNIDCVAILRPTMSPGLWYQMVGRGFRLHPGKQNCLVLDFGGNAIRHGPVDQMRVRETSGSGKGCDAPAKECLECLSVIAAGYAHCPDCGYEFPRPERANHDAQASTESVLSGQVSESVYKVRDVLYSVHVKQGADESAPRTMRVDYKIGFYQFKSEWVCFEHRGYARWKAEMWWRARSFDPVPATAEDAVALANCGALAQTKSITVRSVAGERFDRIVDYELGEKPEPLPLNQRPTADLSDIPF